MEVSSPVPSTPERKTAARDMRRAFMRSFQKAVESVERDRRDEWASDVNADYNLGEILSSGNFGMLFAAQGRDFTFGGAVSAQPRSCVVKVVYLARRVEKALDDCQGDEAFVRRVDTLTLRILTELYVLNRCRQSNLLHSHAVSVSGLDLFIVLPRLYSLESLINSFRRRYNGESMPAGVIMKVVRQVCIALDFLQQIGLAHRDIQTENIFLTRGGTVKLGHFGSARVLTNTECITRVGKKEYMCYEKQFNLLAAQSREECLEYDHLADIWSIGILVLGMITYFPNEKWHRLQPDFATLMHAENMPFKWLITEMMQLRVRLVRCGGSEDLRAWLSDRVLTVDPARRATAAELLESSTLKNLCNESVEEDKKAIAKQLLLALDWPNRLKLETNRPNYDALESQKDIPAEFYWDSTESWKVLEKTEFSFEIYIAEDAVKGPRSSYVSGSFLFSRVHSLLPTLHEAISKGQVAPLDLLALDDVIREMAFIALRNRLYQKASLKHPETSIDLPATLTASHRKARVIVDVLSIRE